MTPADVERLQRQALALRCACAGLCAALLQRGGFPLRLALLFGWLLAEVAVHLTPFTIRRLPDGGWSL